MATTIQETFSLGPGSAVGEKVKNGVKKEKYRRAKRAERYPRYPGGGGGGGMKGGSAACLQAPPPFLLPRLPFGSLRSPIFFFFRQRRFFLLTFHNAKPGPWLRNVKNCENKTNLVYSLVTLPYRNRMSNLKVQTLFFHGWGDDIVQ